MGERLYGRDVVWQLVDGVGLEHCRFASHADGHVIAGMVVTTEDGRPITVEYAVHCDRFWHTREASISVAEGGIVRGRTLRLSSDGDGSWWNEGDSERTAIPQVRGCIDVDLAFTPAINTLPIRRHDMAIGASIEVTAAWVQFPSLEIAVLNQRYTRLSKALYRYESPVHQFVAMLDVDELGLVRSYEGLWQRVAESDVMLPTTEGNGDA